MAWSVPPTVVTLTVITTAWGNTLRDLFNETAPAKVTAAGDLVYATAANTLTRRAIGSQGQLLKVNAAANAPEWGGLDSCHVYNSAALSINNAAWTALTFDSERWDTANFHSIASNTSRIAAPVTGKYLVGANILFGIHATGSRGMRLIRDGVTQLASIKDIAAEGNDDSALHLATLTALNTGQYVEVHVIQYSGGALWINVSDEQSPEFWAVRVA